MNAGLIDKLTIALSHMLFRSGVRLFEGGYREFLPVVSLSGRSRFARIETITDRFSRFRNESFVPLDADVQDLKRKGNRRS